MPPLLPPVFDGHNDVLTKLLPNGPSRAAELFAAGCGGAIDLPKARAGGFGGGFFAIWIASPSDPSLKLDQMTRASYDMPLPAPVPFEAARKATEDEIAVLEALEASGALAICRTVAELRAAMETGTIAAIFHIEGAEAIGPDLAELDEYHARGLRSLGPVWSRPTIFGHGVPFRYPSTPDTGPGLTEAGERLVRRCNELKIMIDLSHLNAAGVADVARISDAPLVASHSNAHAICPHSRNLTDDQLRMIAESDGMVGLNFAAAFLREDGRMLADVPVEACLRHLDHMMGILGEDRVGLGSDYDGAVVPEALTTIADLPVLRQAMVDHGYGAELVDKLCRGNWLRVLEKTWGA
ncbi:dipeptidase [Mangrovicoccus sp. HB161399]|uniref:dipeptidase n=1 Tax=Mangrovicoccus sp. HB161399 TaxID=2720392 RepID=UPI0015522499|nr:dipeptidase [Mangrovicoccus sp. HB161399]